jgi:Zn-finger nucleic acid-binding protein
MLEIQSKDKRRSRGAIENKKAAVSIDAKVIPIPRPRVIWVDRGLIVKVLNKVLKEGHFYKKVYGSGR